jgi:hypothetical protein
VTAKLIAAARVTSFGLGKCSLPVYPFIEMVISDEVVALTSPRLEKYDIPA